MFDAPTRPALAIGQCASMARRIGIADILGFAHLVGDANPLHVDFDAAAAGPFGERIAHGMLTASLLSTVIGMNLPGPGSIYVSQSLRFLAPVRVGDLVAAAVEIMAVDRVRRRVTLRTLCIVDSRPVIDGEAVVQVPRSRLA